MEMDNITNVVLNEGEVMVKAKQDFTKLEEIYEKYKGIMHKEAWLILHNELDVEDAIQKAFENLTKCCDRLEEIDSPRTRNFIRIVTKNAARDIYKEKMSITNIETAVDFIEDLCSTNYTDSLDILIQKEKLNKTIEEIKKLPETMRDVIILEKVFGYTRPETIKLLGENNETLKKRLTRARKKLLESLRKDDLLWKINYLK